MKVRFLPGAPLDSPAASRTTAGYLRGTHMVMVLEVGPEFSFDRKAAADAANPVVQRWETLM